MTGESNCNASGDYRLFVTSLKVLSASSRRQLVQTESQLQWRKVKNGSAVVSVVNNLEISNSVEVLPVSCHQLESIAECCGRNVCVIYSNLSSLPR